jgi:DNA-binding GntR family transcriptional regulator
MIKVNNTKVRTPRAARERPAPDAVPAVDIAESATDRVSQAIGQGIRAGIFVPGQHLLEPELTRRIGISRGSLREALKHLAAAGIVTLNRYRGAYISSLDKKSVLDLLDTLEPLACLAARLAATHCDTAEKKRSMKNAADSIESAGREGNRGRYLELRRHFYDIMLDIGGNQELARVIPLSRTDLFRAQVERFQTEHQRQRHVSGYAKIAAAVIEGNVTAAERAMKRHFEGTRKTMGELPGHAFPAVEAD